MISLILLSCVIGFSNCDNKRINVSPDTTSFEKFQKETKVTFTDFANLGNGNYRRLYLSDSNLYVCNAEPASGDYFFLRFSIYKKTLPDKYIKFGRGYGQALNAFSSGIHKNKTIWLRDISLNKIMLFDLPTRKNIADSILYHEYKTPIFFYSTQLMDSLQLLCAGAHNTPYKIQKMDLVTGNIVSQFGVYSPPKNIPIFSWARSYESAIFLKPSEDKAVLACRYADQIEIFDVRNQKRLIVVKGPENYEPDVTHINIEGNDMIQRNENTRFAFVNGAVNDKYIYLLYSGNQHESQNKIDGKYIYVYDWKGLPVAKLILDRYISGFAISENNSELYAWDNKSKLILKATIKF